MHIKRSLAVPHPSIRPSVYPILTTISVSFNCACVIYRRHASTTFLFELTPLGSNFAGAWVIRSHDGGQNIFWDTMSGTAYHLVVL